MDLIILAWTGWLISLATLLFSIFNIVYVRLFITSPSFPSLQQSGQEESTVSSTPRRTTRLHKATEWLAPLLWFCYCLNWCIETGLDIMLMTSSNTTIQQVHRLVQDLDFAFAYVGMQAYAYLILFRLGRLRDALGWSLYTYKGLWLISSLVFLVYNVGFVLEYFIDYNHIRSYFMGHGFTFMLLDSKWMPFQWTLFLKSAKAYGLVLSLYLLLMDTLLGIQLLYSIISQLKMKRLLASDKRKSIRQRTHFHLGMWILVIGLTLVWTVLSYYQQYQLQHYLESHSRVPTGNDAPTLLDSDSIQHTQFIYFLSTLYHSLALFCFTAEFLYSHQLLPLVVTLLKLDMFAPSHSHPTLDSQEQRKQQWDQQLTLVE